MRTADHRRLRASDAAHLLGRSASIEHGSASRDVIRGRRVLVTGAGGSIGSELVRQLHTLEPEALFLLDRDESSLHAVQLEVFGRGQLDHERTVLADIRDRNRLVRLFRQCRPDVVYHAAAHKHLSILERYPSEAVKTNIIGSENVALAARACGAEHLILISTDKAANPTSVLGATKRLAEHLTRDSSGPTLKTASVRFGNVLGSRGSLLDTLSHQMRTGQPVTVTDPDVERYFMSIPEAAALVIETTILAEEGETYLLDMGDPVRILDLVSRFATMLDVSVAGIRITGLLPGEKLTETLVDESETVEATAHQGIWRVDPARGRCIPPDALALLYEAARDDDDRGVLSALRWMGFAVGEAAATHVAAELVAV